MIPINANAINATNGAISINTPVNVTSDLLFTNVVLLFVLKFESVVETVVLADITFEFVELPSMNVSYSPKFVLKVFVVIPS